MYSACLFCNRDLGTNQVIPSFPRGKRLAFDAARGRLWVICSECHRWNLAPLDERWEAIEECERQFRRTPRRFSTDNIGLGVTPEGLALVRIGPALKPELAAWRYGRYLRRLLPSQTTDPMIRWARQWSDRIRQGLDWGLRRGLRLNPGYEVGTWFRIYANRGRIVALAGSDSVSPIVIRAAHLAASELIRPGPHEPWQLSVAHDGGTVLLSGDHGLRVAGKLLSLLNGSGATEAEVAYALSKVDDAANPDGYFARVATIAMRTSWGRFPNAAPDSYYEAPPTSGAERLALYLTKRSFWGRGGIGAEPRTLLPRLPLVDRLALEMAANEDTERRALEGELALLRAAWHEAEKIAAIADGLLEAESSRIEARRFPLGFLRA